MQNKSSGSTHQIEIVGARANNLKNLSISIPKNKLIVISGVSGSGKSSLAIDTLYAEGQRRYVESLSSYARQFLSRMKKPDIDMIKGICPAIAVSQKASNASVRSTVGSMTEINEYLRLLFARIGRTYSPISQREVKKDQVSDVVDFALSLPPGTKCMVLSPLSSSQYGRSVRQELEILMQKGYSRLWIGEKSVQIDDMIQSREAFLEEKLHLLRDNPSIHLLIDRFVLKESLDTDFCQRIADSINTAFTEGNGHCSIWHDNQIQKFSSIFEIDGIVFPEPEPNLFNPNNSYGACPQCEGYGRVIGISEEKVIPDPLLSVYEGAVQPWKGETGGLWKEQFIHGALSIDFPIHRSYLHLSPEEKLKLWNGFGTVKGINDYFNYLEEKSYKIQNRVTLARYRGKTTCPSCHGKKLRKEALNVKINGLDITEFSQKPIGELYRALISLKLTDQEKKIADRLLIELTQRLSTMIKIGLSYLTLDREAGTLSGGEIQRIQLTRTLSSNLTSSLYILDEPSIGLHARDTEKLTEVLFELRNLGNTVLLVEHDEDIIRNADHLIDIGPGAGIHGGSVVFQGNFKNADPQVHPNSLTVQYLHNYMQIPLKSHRRVPSHFVRIKDAHANNLKNIDINIPLQAITAITGISGSGKSTLVKEILAPGILSYINGNSEPSGPGFKSISGDLRLIGELEFISQNPIGKSSRSNPVTYVKAFDLIRDLYTKQQLAKIRGYKPKHFSFNVEGGRCETCKGEGEITVEMQFLADVVLTCEECNGQRFKKEILEVTYKDKNIQEVLNLSVEEALSFFAPHREIIEKLKPLDEVGLGYLKLGQSSSTLSGGEAQRVKLASYLGKNQAERILFIFDEPTTGLHLHDINKLLKAFEALVEKGHTVIVIEHHLDVIKNADYIIDLGPEAGKEGGYLLYQGPVTGIFTVENSHTAKYLKPKFAKMDD